jgi:hypothetical protein
MDLKEGIKDYKMATAYRQGELEFERDNGNLSKKLAEGTTAENYEQGENLRKKYIDKNIKDLVGIETDKGDVYLYKKPDGVEGQRDRKGGDIYINTEYGSMNNENYAVDVLGHELGHSYGAKIEAESDLHSEKLKNAVNQENKYNGYSVNTSWEGARDWGAQNQNVLDQGNSKLAQVGVVINVCVL